MSRSFGQQTSFKSGEIGSVLSAQVDTPHYKSGLKSTQNCFITSYGTVEKRPGSTYLYTADSNTYRLFPYKTSISESHLLVGKTSGTVCISKTGSVVSTVSAIGSSSTLLAKATYTQEKDRFYYSSYSTTVAIGFYSYITYNGSSFSTSNLGAAASYSSRYLSPSVTKFVSTAGYAITSMTTLAREGQTSYTLSGANPGPFTSGNGFTAASNKVVHALDGVFEITTVTNNYTLVTTCRRGAASTNASVIDWSLEETSPYFGNIICTYNGRYVNAQWYGGGVVDAISGESIGYQSGKIMMSAINNTNDYYPGPNDDDAIDITIKKLGVDGITWMYPGQDLLVGTENNVFSIVGSTPSTVKSVERAGPGGIFQTPMGGHGGVYYIASTQKQIRFMKYDDRLQGYTNDDVTISIPDRMEDEIIADIAVMNEPYPIIFATTNSGKILAGTVIKNALFQSPIVAWTLFADNVKTTWSSPVVMRNDNYDELYIIATRSSTKTVEKFVFNDGTGLTDVFTDGTVVYDGSSTSTITGLAHLNGLVCQVKGQGVQLGNETPSGGSATIDSACTQATVGLSYDFDIDTLPLYIPVGYGSYTHQKARWAEPILQVTKSKAPEVNGKTPSKLEGATTINTMVFYTGPLYYGNVDSGSLNITDSTPFPIHISGIFGTIENGG